MKTQEQVYNAIQSKMSRLCRAEYETHKCRYRNREKMPPVTYSADVDRLVELSRTVLDASEIEAEDMMAEITSGSINHAIHK